MSYINYTDIINDIEKLKLYRQSRIIRWQLRDFVFPENDSEHQLYVTQIIVYLSKVLNISDKDTLIALKYGCTHDYVESCSGVGDVNFALKQKIPKLKDLVEELEENAMMSIPEFYTSMKDCENNKISFTLVNLADALDACLYVRREIRHNKNDEEWKELDVEVTNRVKILYIELLKLLNIDTNEYCN